MYSSFLNISLQERRGFTNFVRLAAAIAVLLSHSKPLSGFGPDSLVGDSPLGEIGVSVFFVLSGYFVFSSGLNHDFRSFVVLRVVRLFPGLITANFCIAFVIGPIVAYFSSQVNYWRSLDGPLSFFSLTQYLCLVYSLKYQIY
jgi:peptidoglycan/LPS O-acetylase OafA/YrhL